MMTTIYEIRSLRALVGLVAAGLAGCAGAHRESELERLAHAESVHEVWHSAGVPAGQGVARGQHLEITRVAVGPQVLVLDVQHTAPDPHQPPHDAQVPEVAVLANQCPMDTPEVAGSIPFNGTAGRVAISTAGFPQGEIALSVVAHEALSSIILYNDAESGLHPITEEERARGVRVTPADAATGQPASAEPVEPPHCPPTKSG
jgi:hypothetical protein